MHCERCGAEITPGAHYCAGCGAPVETQPAPKPDRPSVRERLGRLVGRTRRERMLAAGTVIALAVAVLAFALLDTPDDPIPRDEFTVTADQQCVDAKTAIAAQSVGGSASAATNFSTGVLSTVVEWRQGFGELSVPAGRMAEAAAYDQALLDVIIEFGALSRAARMGEGESEAAAAADDSTARLETAIVDLGLTDCAAVSLGA